MKGENKASTQGRDVRKGHQPERVQSVEKVGGPTGVRFGVPAHHDHSVVKKGGSAKTPEC